MPARRTLTVSDTSIAAETHAALESCLRAHDREGAVRAVLAAVDGGLAIEDLYTLVLEPFLAGVGRSWQEGRTAVWEEHLIVGAVRAAIEALYPRVLERKALEPGVPVTVAFFCPPEEMHDVGLRMLADRFDLRGFCTVYVGAATPVDEMVRCVTITGADVVCLSASTHFQKAALREVVQRLRQTLPKVRLLVGGPAFARSDEGWEEYVVTSLDALLDELAAGATRAGAAWAAPDGSAAAAGEGRTDA
jgi:MerR family transcriptional regulator, light-induced transcriptional regulator